MKILVTGACGFIGSFSRKASKQNYKVAFTFYNAEAKWWLDN